MTERFDYQQQQERDERLRELPWSEYWAKREQDMREQREFWKNWEARWQSKSKP